MLMAVSALPQLRSLKHGGVPLPTVDVINQCTAVANYTINVTSPLSTGSGLPEETFEYDIGGGFQSSPNFTVPNPGDYTIVVRDGNGCTNTVLARVFDFFAISASATSEPTCNAGDGVITVNTTGGSGNFRFELDDRINPPIVQLNDPVFIGILPGSLYYSGNRFRFEHHSALYRYCNGRCDPGRIHR